MPIVDKTPFQLNTLDESKRVDSFTVRLNKEERMQLEIDKKIIEQKRDSTAMKQLAMIGSIVIHDKKMLSILGVLFKNKRNNERQGIVEFD